MSKLIDSILIPTDGSDGAIAGAKYGIALASRTKADVSVISVVEVTPGPEDSEELVFPRLEERADQAVETVADMAHSYDDELQVTTTVKRGTPFQTIREYAHRREIDVIAMGTKGRTGLERVLLGSVTENVLRTARMPVLAVPPDAARPTIEEIPFEQFLLPTDGSDGAEIAAEWGIALAVTLTATIHSLFSVDTSLFSRARNQEEMFDMLERRGEEAIDTVRDRATDAGVSSSGTIATGSPSNVILTYVSDSDVDMIVMGTHGQTGVGQWFLGSVTENVVRQADVPVFCVPISAESPRSS
ncbi:universal stress protein [Halobacteria archaeon AArc-curdl1]|uniref:Universal stress protein n=1 Tax=Natronosalvus hydrolyticus TaxID=2979988 RepID=A0AAP2Z5W9_9EURY|nr:universal stress protein [Halobacteria archaeon AArc-curdl1]